MPAKPLCPWYRAARSAWFVTLRGRQHFLGDHPADAPPPKKLKGRWNAPEQILRAFHQLLAEESQAVPALPAGGGLTVAEVFEKFLDWCQRHRAAGTYGWYKGHLQSFLDSLPDPDGTAAAALRPYHVVEWADAHPGWGDAWRRGAIIAVQRPFNWAAKLGYIDHSPVRNVEKPQPQRRERYVSPEEWAAIRDHYPPGDPFRELLEFCWETGCRPQEAKAVEARHVALDRKVILFPPAEAKGKKRWRRILLEGRALEIVTRLLADRPKGRLFVNADGRPWTRHAMNCRFQRLKKHLGATYCGYLFRHGFANRMLTEGVDHLTVAELLGHRDGTMLAKVYQHLDRRDDHLRRALRGDGSADS